jgi:hypothetical protein
MSDLVAIFKHGILYRQHIYLFLYYIIGPNHLNLDGSHFLKEEEEMCDSPSSQYAHETIEHNSYLMIQVWKVGDLRRVSFLYMSE